MNTVSFRNIQELRSSNGLLKGFNQVVVITDDILGGIFKTIRKGDAVLDGGVYIQGDSRYDLKRVYDNINVDVVWFGSDLTRFFNYCASKDEYAYMSTGVFDLNGESIELPANLKIKSGAGYFTNGTLVGNDTYLEVNEYHKLFDHSIVFEGDWKSVRVTPQNFGAITNHSNDVFANDCSSAIQAALDSPFDVYIPAGFYYTPNTLNVRKAKSILMVGGDTDDPFTSADNYTGDYNHTRFYSDQANDLLKIQASNVYIQKGVFDTSKMQGLNPVAIRYDISGNRIFGGEIDCTFVGDRHTLPNEGAGTIAVLFDQTNVTSFGFATFINIKGFFRCVKHPILVEAVQNPHGTYINTINFTGKCDGIKQIRFESGAASTIKGESQSRHVLHSSEKDMPIIYIGSAGTITVDWFAWDLNSDEDTNGYWKNNRFIENNSTGTQLMGRSFHRFNLNDKIITNAPFASNAIVRDSKRFIITKNNRKGFNDPVISKLDNQLAFVDKYGSLSIKAFKGTGYDFDENLNETVLSETTDIVINNPGNLMGYEGAPTSIIFAPTADLDNDFVEIVIEPGEIRWSRLSMVLYNPGYTNFKRLQLIEIHPDNSTTTSSIYPVTHFASRSYIYDFEEISLINSNKLIFRLIGATEASNPILIKDIIGYKSFSEREPLINIGGGQTIYGDLTLDGSIIANKLAVGNSTAATVAGTITNKIEVFDKSGVSLGFVPVYDSIT